MQATISVLGIDRFVFGSESDDYFQAWADAGAYSGPSNIVPYELSVRPDSVCIDIGANLGLTALLMCELAPRGHVYAFEPEPRNFRFLSKTMRANGIDNCTAIQLAVGSAPGCLRLKPAGPYSHVDLLDDPSSVQVDVVTLDRWVDETRLPRLDLLKVDVEGHEQSVLSGARRSISELRPCVIIEFNSLTTIRFGRTLPYALLDDIMELFPKVAVVDRQSGMPQLLGRALADREAFVVQNLMTGFVDDLICYFDDAQIRRTTLPSRRGGFKRDSRAGQWWERARSTFLR